MKYLETLFDDYIKSEEKCSLHEKNREIYKSFPNSISDFKNLIFYGPKGIGKYTQMLTSIKKYSQSNLKYEKKISINFNKNPYYFKISDIHYEIDMSLLGCNSRTLWNEIYNQIVDIISTKQNNTGIIVCKNFQEIHSELLECFYSYMQSLPNSSINIKYIIITEELSFIPDNIIKCCQSLHIQRPNKTAYTKCFKKSIKNVNINNITNIKNVKSNIGELHIYKPICDIIIDNIKNFDNINYVTLRDNLYDIFIYNLDIQECIWYILTTLINENIFNEDNISNIMLKTYSFLQYYNNNYRPIYHLESYIYYLITNLNEF